MLWAGGGVAVLNDGDCCLVTMGIAVCVCGLGLCGLGDERPLGLVVTRLVHLKRWSAREVEEGCNPEGMSSSLFRYTETFQRYERPLAIGSLSVAWITLS